MSDIETIRALSSLCPNLSGIDLKKGQVVSSYGLEHFVSMIGSPSTASVDDTPHEQLESILRGMSKVLFSIN